MNIKFLDLPDVLPLGLTTFKIVSNINIINVEIFDALNKKIKNIVVTTKNNNIYNVTVQINKFVENGNGFIKCYLKNNSIEIFDIVIDKLEINNGKLLFKNDVNVDVYHNTENVRLEENADSIVNVEELENIEVFEQHNFYNEINPYLETIDKNNYKYTDDKIDVSTMFQKIKLKDDSALILNTNFENQELKLKLNAISGIEQKNYKRKAISLKPSQSPANTEATYIQLLNTNDEVNQTLIFTLDNATSIINEININDNNEYIILSTHYSISNTDVDANILKIVKEDDNYYIYFMYDYLKEPESYKMLFDIDSLMYGSINFYISQYKKTNKSNNMIYSVLLSQQTPELTNVTLSKKNILIDNNDIIDDIKYPILKNIIFSNYSLIFNKTGYNKIYGGVKNSQITWDNNIVYYLINDFKPKSKNIDGYVVSYDNPKIEDYFTNLNVERTEKEQYNTTDTPSYPFAIDNLNLNLNITFTINNTDGTLVTNKLHTDSNGHVRAALKIKNESITPGRLSNTYNFRITNNSSNYTITLLNENYEELSPSDLSQDELNIINENDTLKMIMIKAYQSYVFSGNIISNALYNEENEIPEGWLIDNNIDKINFLPENFRVDLWIYEPVENHCYELLRFDVLNDNWQFSVESFGTYLKQPLYKYQARLVYVPLMETIAIASIESEGQLYNYNKTILNGNASIPETENYNDYNVNIYIKTDLNYVVKLNIPINDNGTWYFVDTKFRDIYYVELIKKIKQPLTNVHIVNNGSNYRIVGNINKNNLVENYYVMAETNGMHYTKYDGLALSDHDTYNPYGDLTYPWTKLHLCETSEDAQYIDINPSNLHAVSVQGNEISAGFHIGSMFNDFSGRAWNGNEGGVDAYVASWTNRIFRPNPSISHPYSDIFDAILFGYSDSFPTSKGGGLAIFNHYGRYYSYFDNIDDQSWWLSEMYKSMANRYKNVLPDFKNVILNFTIATIPDTVDIFYSDDIEYDIEFLFTSKLSNQHFDLEGAYIELFFTRETINDPNYMIFSLYDKYDNLIEEISSKNFNNVFTDSESNFLSNNVRISKNDLTDLYTVINKSKYINFYTHFRTNKGDYLTISTTNNKVTANPFSLTIKPEQEYLFTIIDTPEKLLNISINDKLMNEKNYILTENLDMTGITDFKPISNFSGMFLGNGKTISNLEITNVSNEVTKMNSSGTGLFANTKGAFINNLTLDNCTIVGEQNVGALIGISNKSAYFRFRTIIDNVTISNCDISNNDTNLNSMIDNNTITGSANIYMGALCGKADETYITNILIIDSSVTGNINTTKTISFKYVSGMFGQGYNLTCNNNIVVNNVVIDTNGQSNTSVSNCETFGQIYGNVANDFNYNLFLDDISYNGVNNRLYESVANNAGYDVHGKSLVELKTDSTYPHANWEFGLNLIWSKQSSELPMLNHIYKYQILSNKLHINHIIETYNLNFQPFNSLVGGEIFNRRDIYTKDRIIWDNILNEYIPYVRDNTDILNKQYLWGFGGDDNHTNDKNYDSHFSWNSLILPTFDWDNYTKDELHTHYENVKKCVQQGNFFISNRSSMFAINPPTINALRFDNINTKISIEVKESFAHIQWIFDGVIDDDLNDTTAVDISDHHATANYVRIKVYYGDITNEARTLTQPIILDGSTGKIVYNPYENCDFDNDTQYKFNFHSHTYYSDGKVAPSVRINEYLDFEEYQVKNVIQTDKATVNTALISNNNFNLNITEYESNLISMGDVTDNVYVAEIYATTQQETGRFISYHVPPEEFENDKIGFDIISNRIWAYDQALGAIATICYLKDNNITFDNIKLIERRIQALLDMQLSETPDGNFDNEWCFSYNADSGIYTDFYMRTGTQMWVLMALLFYYKKFINDVDRNVELLDNVKTSIINGLDTIIDKYWHYDDTNVNDLRNNTFLGGSGRYNPNGLFDETYIAEWSSTEHNTDAYWVLKWVTELNFNSNNSYNYDNIFAELKNSLVSEHKFWDNGLNRAVQGLSVSSKDETHALDCNSWYSIAIRDYGNTSKADASIDSADNLRVEFAPDNYGYKIYSSMEDTIWIEGSAGMVMAFKSKGDITESVNLFSSLAKTIKFDGFSYATRNASAGDDQIQTWTSLASTAWMLIVASPNGFWNQTEDIDSVVFANSSINCSNISKWKNISNDNLQILNLQFSKDYYNLANMQLYKNYYLNNIDMRDDKIYYNDKSSSIGYDDSSNIIVNYDGDNLSMTEIENNGLYNDYTITVNEVIQDLNNSYEFITSIYKVISEKEFLIHNVFKRDNDVAILSNNLTDNEKIYIDYNLNDIQLSAETVEEIIVHFDFTNLKTISNSVNQINVFYKYHNKPEFNYEKMLELDLTNFDILNNVGYFRDQTTFDSNVIIESDNTNYIVNDYDFKIRPVDAINGFNNFKFQFIDKLYLVKNTKYYLHFSSDFLTTDDNNSVLISLLSTINNLQNKVIVTEFKMNKGNYENNIISFYVENTASYTLQFNVNGNIALYDVYLQIFNVSDKITPNTLSVKTIVNDEKLFNSYIDFKFELIGENKTMNYYFTKNNILIEQRDINKGTKGGLDNISFMLFDVEKPDEKNDEFDSCLNDQLANINIGVNVYVINNDRNGVIAYDELKGINYFKKFPKTRKQYSEIYPVIDGDVWIIEDVPIDTIPYFDETNEIPWNHSSVIELTEHYNIGDNVTITVDTAPSIYAIYKFREFIENDQETNNHWYEVVYNDNNSDVNISFEIVDEIIHNESYLYVLAWNNTNVSS